jgi:hypothetical protein
MSHESSSSGGFIQEQRLLLAWRRTQLRPCSHTTSAAPAIPASATAAAAAAEARCCALQAPGIHKQAPLLLHNLPLLISFAVTARRC